ncbi:NADPH-dependent FMN reductase [Variovorax sp. EL159]|uniref:NADPH-dependent FMN reductase n=1 Tax=Variovorax sp. EL159 TaxID=1566270 RepID=UPI00087DF8CA|nr:NADPH-dependent FMN reductase [Variovorax sp. EL159]SCX73660.1 NAD(P)H-dependent FMN reductase [Variovorax sp. EL159]
MSTDTNPKAGAASRAIDVIGLCGSLRSASLNGMALNLAGDSMPPAMTLDVVDWRDIPPFDADVLAHAIPAPVEALRDRIRRADAVLIATPEYNFSIPGMLKNMLDWVSRGIDQPLRHKPVAILSAAPGPVGGARVQYELRKVLLFMDAMVLSKPEVFIAHAASKFAPDGTCTDETTRRFVAEQMAAFEHWIDQVGLMHQQQQR